MAYDRFQLLDGSHPWREVSPDGYVDYLARPRRGGAVVYFNFDLAREIELLPRNHASRMTRPLERAVLETFSLQIINEYDLARADRSAPESSEVRGPFMATRYLQLQHKDKRGLHSGDGRAIWNGSLKTSRGVTYDVSSRGTGATRLSPGAQVADGPIQTGDDSWGYSCGQADLDEMLATALMSEIFHRNGFPTERTLAVIGFDNGMAIGVRAAPNLLRPAHIFRYLKQGRHAELKASLDYLIDRQVANGEWEISSKRRRDPRERYRSAVTHIARSFGRLAAICQEEYIFNWLCWDGDNLLASGAILDYGSIRQFAAKHDKYRYDDVDRFSSSLNEQRYWARQIVQAFAQAADFAATGRKRRFRRFKNAVCLAHFDAFFEREREWRILWRLGFTPDQIEAIRRRGRSELSDLRRALSFFEDVKVARGVEKLPDGVTHFPVFVIRNLLRELPAFYARECDGDRAAMMDPQRFCETMAAEYASRRDLKMTASRAARARNFQHCYKRLIDVVGDYPEVVRQLADRSAAINFEQRITGDAIMQVVDRFIRSRRRFDVGQFQFAMDRFIESQVLIPDAWRPIDGDEISGRSPTSKLLSQIVATLDEFKQAV